jgi:hypothetical protein
MTTKKYVRLHVCPECLWSYSDTVAMSGLYIAGQYTKPICGICALTIMNRTLPVAARRRQFQGQTAEDFRQDALRWRKDHPECAPKKETAAP